MSDGLAVEVRRMKQADGPNIVIMGSGSIVSQLTEEGLIDEYQIVVIPIIIGSGRTMFEGVKQRRALTLTGSRIFQNGNALLRYEPVK